MEGAAGGALTTDFGWTRAQFALPAGVVYLDGNSLGPLPRAAQARVGAVMRDEWGEMLITAWNRAGWMERTAGVGERICRLVGAPPGGVVMGDTLSIRVYQALAAALSVAPAGRRVILSDTGNFPTDLYMAQGLIDTLGKGHELRLVAAGDVEAAITDEVAVVMLSEVDYRSGRLHDMAALTRRAHEVGALTVWDLAHSAGAIAVDLAASGADFAVGCSYKFLNGGPGAPAFIHAAPRWADRVRAPLPGWHGHAEPFAFDLRYRPAPGMARMRIGTPPVLALAALDAALEIWDRVAMADLRARSIVLGDLLIAEAEARCPGLVLASPRDGTRRGSQVSFRFSEGYAAMQALIARGVIGDFRAPDIMRFGITPLYSGEADILRAVDVLEEVFAERLWEREEYRVRAAVT